MVPTPLFSVVVPLYNKRSFIRRTLTSIMAQSHRAFEVVIVDDNSTDGSVDAIADLLGGSIRLIHQANAGPGAARNRGCAEARGAWIAFIDADDLWTSDHLAALARIIAAAPLATVVATTSRHMDATDAAAALAGQRERAIREIDYFAEGGEAIVHTSSVAVERHAFDRSGGFGAFCPGEDEEFWSRLGLTCRFAISDAVTSTYLRANQGLMDQAAAAAGAPITIATSPVGQTLRAALSDAAYRPRHGAIKAYLRRLALRDTRICLYAGYPGLARESLKAVGAVTSLEQSLYWLLAIMPKPASRWAAHAYPAVRSRRNAVRHVNREEAL